MMIYHICTKCFAKKEENYISICVGGKRSKKYTIRMFVVCILKLKKYGTGSVRFSYDVQKSHKIFLYHILLK